MQPDLGHTLVGRVGQYTDLVGCVQAQLAQVAIPQALTLLGGAGFIPLRPKAFLELLGMSGLQPCTQTHLKKCPCAILVRLVGCMTNTNLMQPCYLVVSCIAWLRQDEHPNSNNLFIAIAPKSNLAQSGSNLRRSLLRFSTRPNEWGTQWDSNSLV